MKKIHFINRIDWDNAGDWGCCHLITIWIILNNLT